ncbi:DUF3127 domain-containing protein [Dysgonomonas capnocytophagoides]|uniref:DUF3127 domain-containing protein n=1 Tax=Dysgonomonas capnocytophagoides TaxID=45254 RepID=UPI002923EAC7|nr:DUF3127 domain-containing protein [Dysgonomonas capnocytophagoides]
MNLKGKVIQLLPVETGAGKNGEWKKQSIIIETEGQYPKKVCVSLWGDKVETVANGAAVDVSLDLESREYNGRWYTEARAWKVDAVGGNSAPSQSATPQQSAPQQGGDDDNMPF